MSCSTSPEEFLQRLAKIEEKGQSKAQEERDFSMPSSKPKKELSSQMSMMKEKVVFSTILQMKIGKFNFYFFLRN